MAYDILLDPPSYFQPRDVADIPFIHSNVPELRKVELAGNVAAWAEYIKLARGESITAHEVYRVKQKEGEDIVAWVRRTGTTALLGTVEDYDYSQLVCNHAAEADDGIEFEEALLACEAVASVIERRAYLIRERLENRKLLDKHKEESFMVGRSARHTVKDLATFVLEREQTHPHTWYANLMSGRHTVSGLASIFEMETKHMGEVVRNMVADGIVELHGDEVITLKEAA